MSRLLKGVAASAGVAVGPIHRHRDELPPLPEGRPANTEAEIERFRRAVGAVTEHLSRLEETTRAKVGDDAAEIFAAHAMFLEDPAFIGPIEEEIRTRGVFAEVAVSHTAERVAGEFAEMEDEYFAARAADIRDLGNQLLRQLLGVGQSDLSTLTEPSIIVAHDLTPSDTALIPPGMALGFCTMVGSAVSHTAILARSLGIPAVVGIGEVSEVDGTTAILDGTAGTVLLDPSEEEVAAARAEIERRERERAEAALHAREPAATLDGHAVEVVANVGNSDEAERAAEAGAEGIGLVRTEFMFLDRPDLPGEEEQVEGYRAILSHFPTGPVVFRTLDVGGDKQLPGVEIAPELNPFLGKRGIRLTLAEQAIFRTQLRAILRAGPGRPVHVMFPMVASVSEVRAARQVLDEVVSELDREGTERATDIEVGVMIEVPSAALMADLLADEVDFFSIGTNDLTQYTLAVDRTNPVVAPLADALHPAVLRLIRQVVEAAHERGRWVGVCGELAGDTLATPVLVGLSVDELSMSPPSVPLVKNRIRSLSRETCRELARQCLAAEDPAQVRELLAAS
ncbi:MAG TPA: phosphoenolpyruvate--protein phosphotransferase [Acidimicrobiia bacterium]|jgi:phosphoenolpyruvate-protein phosphotransferase